MHREVEYWAKGGSVQGGEEGFAVLESAVQVRSLETRTVRRVGRSSSPREALPSCLDPEGQEPWAPKVQVG